MAASHDFKIGDSVRIVAGSQVRALGKIISILPDPRSSGKDFITIRIADDGGKVKTASVFPEDLRHA